MFTQPTLALSLAFLVLAASVSADSLAYVVNGNNQFGTVDLPTGAFQQIGPNTPEGEAGLAPGPNGSLLTLAWSGNLYSINPATGAATLAGPTGLADCSAPTSPLRAKLGERSRRTRRRRLMGPTLRTTFIPSTR